MILNIKCNYKEYRLIDNKWKLVDECHNFVDEDFITNMKNASIYFSKLGGYMNITLSKNRRYNLVCSKIVSISICRTIKKIYNFEYDNSFQVDI